MKSIIILGVFAIVAVLFITQTVMYGMSLDQKTQERNSELSFELNQNEK